MLKNKINKTIIKKYITCFEKIRNKKRHFSTFKFPYKKNHPKHLAVITYTLHLQKGNHLVLLEFTQYNKETHATLGLFIDTKDKPITKLDKKQWKCYSQQGSMSFFNNIGHEKFLGVYDNHIPYIYVFVKKFFADYIIVKNEINVVFYGLYIKKYKKFFIFFLISFFCCFIVL